MSEKKKVLVTGASGFIGHCLIEVLSEQGYEPYAGVRKGSRTCELERMGVPLVRMDLDHPEILREELKAFREKKGRWEYIVHTAGVTKCRDKGDFDRVNYLNTRCFLDLLREGEMIPRKFIFLSSLSVFGPIHEQDGLPIGEQDVPAPNTAYGRSKLRAENYLKSLGDVPSIILRPTGVYGPREKDYFMMAKSLQQHLDFSVGFRPQVLTFVYVKDVAQAVLRSIETEAVNRSYFLSDGAEYSSLDFSNLLQKELGVKRVCRLRVPLWFLKAVSFVAQFFACLGGRSSTLNPDKYKIMKQRNWRCDITPAREELHYVPQYDLSRGVKETINWYKKEKWL